MLTSYGCVGPFVGMETAVLRRPSDIPGLVSCSGEPALVSGQGSRRSSGVEALRFEPVCDDPRVLGRKLDFWRALGIEKEFMPKPCCALVDQL